MNVKKSLNFQAKLKWMKATLEQKKRDEKEVEEQEEKHLFLEC